MTSRRAGLLLLAATLAHAYTFVFNTTPTQCENATLSIVGDDGVPPYNVVMLAYGSAPGGNEIRKIIDHSFNDKTTSVLMAFPANAGFVAVVSDSKAFGSGGTTISINTGSSDDKSCLPQPGSLSPGFTFGFAYPDETVSLTQCQTKRITYSNTTQGDVKFYGVVPGGTSFEIPVTNPQPFDGGSHVFSWQVNVPKFIDVLLLAGDARGRGSGGSTPTIFIGDSDDTSCLQGSSITSTPGTPAGAVQPTNTSGGSNTDSGGGSNIGAIVGGVIGGLVFIILVLAGALFFMWKRRRARRDNKIREKPDLTDDPRPLAVSNDDSLQPEPFIVPPSVTSASRPGTPSEATGPAGAVPPSAWARGQSFERRYSGGQMSGLGRPLSLATTTDEGGGGPASSIGGLSAWERKHGASGGPQLRPVNVVQHEDGGEVVGENDTVELPPAYGNIRPRASPQPDSESSQ